MTARTRKPPLVLGGHTIRFERRRYSDRTFTWAYLVREGREDLLLGNPWPCVTPKRSELLEQIALCLKYEAEQSAKEAT